MVCNRCKMVVKNEIEKLGYQTITVELGEVELENTGRPINRDEILQTLQPLGFELIDDKRSQLIEQIKTTIIDLVHNKNNDLRTNLSNYLNNLIHHDYHYLSNLFSEVEGTTIEKYLIAQKIEKVKELLMYDELSLSEIAWKLNYSSVAHLSNQFKKVTGLTPTHFKNIKTLKRKPLDKV